MKRRLRDKVALGDGGGGGDPRWQLKNRAPGATGLRVPPTWRGEVDRTQEPQLWLQLGLHLNSVAEILGVRLQG